jgi:DNA-binding MarR family transcriptional regulator
VNALELFLLGRKLMKLGEEAIPQSIPGSQFHQMPTSVRSVLVDVYEHPGSSISEITARTGFPQSHVSAAVARLREKGGVITTTDPADRRRTLAAPNPEVWRRLSSRQRVPVDAVLARAIGTDDPGEVAGALAALDLLARLLTPNVPARRPSQAGSS